MPTGRGLWWCSRTPAHPHSTGEQQDDEAARPQPGSVGLISSSSSPWARPQTQYFQKQAAEGQERDSGERGALGVSSSHLPFHLASGITTPGSLEQLGGLHSSWALTSAHSPAVVPLLCTRQCIGDALWAPPCSCA